MLVFVALLAGGALFFVVILRIKEHLLKVHLLESNHLEIEKALLIPTVLFSEK